MALTDQELRDMEVKLKEAFGYAATGVDKFAKKIMVSPNDLTFATATISAMANTVQALISVNNEMEKRGMKP